MTVTMIQPRLAEAHSGSVGYSDVHIKGKQVTVDLFLLADLLGGLLNIDQDQDGYMQEDELAQAKPAIEQFIFKNFSIINNGLTGQVQVTHLSLAERGNLSMIQVELDYVFEEPVEEYEIDYFIFYKDIDVNHQNFMTIYNGDQKVEKIFTKEKNIFQGKVVKGGEKEGVKAATNAPQSEILGFGDYLLMGMKHIWSGIDHLLFIFGLLLAKGTYRDYVKTLTAFTIGHCLTLALAATETLFIPGRIIEPLIALSIIYVAVENIWAKSFKWRWLVALSFGLIHGFGFAELLIGKLGGHFTLPLFSFNLGVEIGQIVVLIIMIPLIWSLRRVQWQRKAVYSLSSMISVIGLYWFIERVLQG